MVQQKINRIFTIESKQWAKPTGSQGTAPALPKL